MRKNNKRKYLSPETEIVRFNVDDIITTSTTPPDGGEIATGSRYLTTPEISDPEVNNP